MDEQMDFLGSANAPDCPASALDFSGLELQSCIHSLNYHLVFSLCYKEGLGALCDVSRCAGGHRASPQPGDVFQGCRWQ